LQWSIQTTYNSNRTLFSCSNSKPSTANSFTTTTNAEYNFTDQQLFNLTVSGLREPAAAAGKKTVSRDSVLRSARDRSVAVDSHQTNARRRWSQCGRNNAGRSSVRRAERINGKPPKANYDRLCLKSTHRVTQLQLTYSDVRQTVVYVSSARARGVHPPAWGNIGRGGGEEPGVHRMGRRQFAHASPAEPAQTSRAEVIPGASACIPGPG
jgi:hypothetical protein